MVDVPLYSSDPITELLERLHDGTLGLEWATRWSVGGVEPLAGAWAASRQPLDMLTVLLEARRTDDATRVALECDPDRMCRVCFVGRRSFNGEVTEWDTEPTGNPCRPCADDVRRIVPTPPTLAELLEARNAA